ncbi:MAG: insulinase family protein [Fibrobacterales bacterium]
MKKFLLGSILVVMGCASHKTGQSDIVAHYSELTYPKMEYTAPNPMEYRHVLSNGTPVYLYPQKGLPLVSVNFTFKESNYSDSLSHVATRMLLSSMYRRGGTATLSADSVDAVLDFISAQVAGGLSDYESSIQLDVVSKDLYSVLGLTRDIFLNPGIDEKRLNQTKEQYIQNIHHQYDHPASVSRVLYSHVLYGEHPINWDVTEEAVAGVTRDAILANTGGRFNPQHLILGIAGDFDTEEVLAYLEDYFSKWQVKSREIAKIAEPLVIAKPGVYIVDKKVSQTHIRMGQPFIKRPHPDYYAATVASYILGSGGFTSRLVSKIRTDEGLAYTVRSFTGSSYNYQKTSGVSLQTKNETAVYAVKLCLQELQKFIDEGMSDAELQRAKDYFVQSIPSIFDTPENTVDFFVMSEKYGRDSTHMALYVSKIQALTQKDVQNAAEKYFNPQNMVITLVGPQNEITLRDEAHGVSLEDFGAISLISEDDLLIQ